MEDRLPRQVLVVEDEPRIALIVQSGVELMGYRVVTAGTGQAALRQVEEETPDLVILDLRLPDMHGYDVCRHLRQHHDSWALPVLMLTALDQPMDQLRGFAHGADAYLTKPFELPDLMETVAQLMGQAAAS